jgi:3'-phosphoadenosine 5'-phosphosulfate sulfotransferase (PAPS reductase)/FAD synthetase
MNLTDYVIFASYGNDSIATIQFMHERGYGSNVIVAYTDTGWAAKWWHERVAKAEAWAQSLRFRTARIDSEGMESLVERKKAWPRGGGGKYQFCTDALKKEPARIWLDKIDPCKDITCVVGIRREESDNRATFPMWTTASDDHGCRELYAPLVMHTELMRNELIAKTPMPVLPYRSKECSPCANATKQELRHISDSDSKKVFWLEQKMGVNSKGNDRVMFSPARHNGAIGILAVIEDAKHGHDDLFQTVSCDAGWCGG